MSCVNSAEASPDVGTASVEEVMDMAACRYVDFPGIGTIDLDAPELPGNDRELLEVVMERMFAGLMILETIGSVASVLRQYESAGGSAPPPCWRQQREFSRNPRTARSRPRLRPRLHRPEQTLAEAVASAAAATVADTTESVVGEVGLSSPRPVATAAEEVPTPGEPAATLQEHVAPEGTTRASSMEIQEAEQGAGAALLQGTASGEAQTLELACTSWAAAFKSGDDAEDDEEVATLNTLERGLEWACRAFEELILPATSVSFFT
jgi:hypothetical protein